MAKLGTAHIEIKPVLNEDALTEITKRIEDAVAAGVTRALNTAAGQARAASWPQDAHRPCAPTAP